VGGLEKEDKVHVLQGIVTEGRDEVIKGIVSMIVSACCICAPCLAKYTPCYAPSSIKHLASDVNPKVTELVVRRCGEGRKVNVVLLDWVTGWPDVSWIVELNLGSAVKREHEQGRRLI